MAKKRKAIFLAGHFDAKDTSMWKEWFTTIEKLLKNNDIFPYGIELSGEGYTTGKIYCRNRILKRLNKIFKEKKEIETLGLYAFDPKYKYIDYYRTIIFLRDYTDYKGGRIWCEFNNDTFSDFEIDNIIIILKQFINLTYGELIHQDLSRHCPFLISRMINYHSGDGPANEKIKKEMNITTLKIIKEESIPRQY